MDATLPGRIVLDSRALVADHSGTTLPMDIPSTPAAAAPSLVDRCRRGDREAWRELVETYSRYVYAIILRGYRLSESDAEDVFQDVFARVFERLETLRDDEAPRGERVLEASLLRDRGEVVPLCVQAVQLREDGLLRGAVDLHRRQVGR